MSSSDKSSEDKAKLNQDDEIILKPSKNMSNKNTVNDSKNQVNDDIILKVNNSKI